MASFSLRSGAQTGAGKTYTLSNTEQDAIGMMPRACMQVFNQISQHPADTFTVFMSIVQLYTERIQVHHPRSYTAASHVMLLAPLWCHSERVSQPGATSSQPEQDDCSLCHIAAIAWLMETMA